MAGSYRPRPDENSIFSPTFFLIFDAVISFRFQLGFLSVYTLDVFFFFFGGGGGSYSERGWSVVQLPTTGIDEDKVLEQPSASRKT